MGGGPAGLSAALILDRCRRKVLVIDHGEPRNRQSQEMHGCLTRDGIDPAEFLRLAREELRSYGTVELRQGEAIDAAREGGDFSVRCADGQQFRGARLLLATGVRDEIPSIEGVEALYGRSVHHCPYCDGWEWRSRPLAVYGKGSGGVGLALGLTVWTDDIVLCTDGPAEISPEPARQLEALGIDVRNERVLKLEGEGGCLRRVIFASGEPLEREALFFCTGQTQASDLARRLGRRFNDQGVVDAGKGESTNVPGLFVCGDASKDAQFVIVAAAEGAQAAVAINQSLRSGRS